MLLKHELEQKLQDIVFIELKKEYQLRDISLPVGTSLPIRLEHILNDLKEDKEIENISAEKIVDSIIYLLGIDKDFIYKKQYLDILIELGLDLKKYTMHKSFENQETQIIDSFIYLNSYLNILGEDKDILFKQANILEAYYNQTFSEREIEENNKILENVIRRYNNILNIDEQYELAYYRLAYINLNMNRFIKSKLYFEKFINYSKDEELKQDARSKIEMLKNYVLYDSARAYISRGNFTKAKKDLENIDNNYTKEMQYYYLLGLCEFNLGELEEAEKSINKSISYKINEENINLLAMIHLNKEEFNKAIQTYKIGIENLQNSFTLNYNLGLVLLDIGDKIESFTYLEKAYEISPQAELKKFIKSLK